MDPDHDVLCEYQGGVVGLFCQRGKQIPVKLTKHAIGKRTLDLQHPAEMMIDVGYSQIRLICERLEFQF